MPSEKNILTSFARRDLQAAVTKLKVEVSDRRRIDALIAGLLKGHDGDFAGLLSHFAAPALKAACEALDTVPEGRGKAAWVAALSALAPAKKVRGKASAKANSAAAAPLATKAAKAVAAGIEAKAKAKAKTTAKAPAAVKKAVVPQSDDLEQIMPKPARAPKGEKAKAKAPKLVEQPKPAIAAAAEMAEPAQAFKAEAPHADQPGPQPPAQEPAKKSGNTRRGPLSWSEAAQMAEHRGQSAATMLRGAQPQASGTTQHTCNKCHIPVTLQACQVQACNNYYVAAPGRKICSECLFERNTISMDDFNDRLHEERQCTHCGVPMTHLSGGNA